MRDESFFTAKIAEASQSSLRTTKTSCANPVFLGDLCGEKLDFLRLRVSVAESLPGRFATLAVHGHLPGANGYSPTAGPCLFVPLTATLSLGSLTLSSKPRKTSWR